MAKKQTAFQNLAAAAESDRPAEAAEATGRLRIPTMEQRTLIFLRATLARADFSSEELAAARKKIMDAMAGDIVTRSEPSDDDKEPITGILDKEFGRMRLFLRKEIHAGIAMHFENYRAAFEKEVLFRVEAAVERSQEAQTRMSMDLQESRSEYSAARLVSRPDASLFLEEDQKALRSKPASLGAQAAGRAAKPKKARLRIFFFGVIIATVGTLSVLGAMTLVRMYLDWLHVPG